MDKYTLQQLVDQGKSITQISSQTGYGKTTVRYWLKKHGLKTHWVVGDGFKFCRQHKPSRIKIVSDEEAVRMQAHYDNGGTYRSLMKEFKVSNSVLERLKADGRLKMRSSVEASAEATKRGRRDVFKSQEYRDSMRKQTLDRFEKNPELHPNRRLAANRKKMSFPERRVFDELTTAQIPFQHNARVGPYYIDFLFDSFGVEIDGKRWHDPVRDARRDAEIAEQGIAVVRFDSQVAAKKTWIVIDEIKRRLRAPAIPTIL